MSLFKSVARGCLLISFISYCLCLRLFENNVFFVEIHEQIHRALFIGQRLQAQWLKNSLVELGIMHIFVLSGMHFYFACKLTEDILPRKYHVFVPFLFLALWEPSIPVIRSFFYCLFQSIDKLRGESFSPSYLFFLSLLSSCFFVTTKSDYHSLWLSSCFFLLIQTLYQQAKLSQSLGQFVIFCLSPLILPFSTNLHPISFLANIFLAPILLIVFYLSPLLHLLPKGHDLCQKLILQSFYLLQEACNFLDLHHPYPTSGKNLLIINLVFAFLYWRFDCYRLKKSLY